MTTLGFEDELGDVIRKAIFGLGLKEADTAQRVGITPSVLLSIESYERSPDDDTIDRLAHVLQLSAPGLRALRDKQPPLDEAHQPCVHRLHFSRYTSNGYVITAGDHRLLIDPGANTPELRDVLDEPVDAILLTHTHYDHVSGLEAVLRAHAAPVFAMPEANLNVPFEPLKEGEGPFGVRVLGTPGHSRDGATFVVDGAAFTGDCVFGRSLGRAQSSNTYPDLLQSAGKILSLPEETVLYPGHGGTTTVSLEQAHNPFFLSA